MNLIQSNNYVKSHGILVNDHQVFLTKPLKVFKKIQTYSSVVEKEFIKLKYCANKNAHRRLFSKLYFSYHNTEDAIANLIIPIGAIVKLADSFEKKFRASESYCWSICRINKYDKHKLLNGETISGYSSHRRNHIYISGKALGLISLPKLLRVTTSESKSNTYNNPLLECRSLPDSFDYGRSGCSNGIHFFIESKLAVNY